MTDFFLVETSRRIFFCITVDCFIRKHQNETDQKMGLNCGASMIKYILFVFNLICAVSLPYEIISLNNWWTNKKKKISTRTVYFHRRKLVFDVTRFFFILLSKYQKKSRKNSRRCSIPIISTRSRTQKKISKERLNKLINLLSFLSPTANEYC